MDDTPSLGGTGRRMVNDHGSSDALGLAMIAPVIIALAVAVLFISRGVDTRATAQSAAEAAAQAAAQQRNYGAAQAAAQRVGNAMLTDTRTCASPSVQTSVDGPGGYGPGATLAITVTCFRNVSDLSQIAPTGDNRAAYTAFAIIDPYRSVDT